MKFKHIEGLKGFKSLTEDGTFEAAFSTLGVIDIDGDLTEYGAIVDGTPVKVSAYNHSSWSGALPVGRGKIYEVGNELHVKGEFFLDTVPGSETYKTVKHLQDMQEWSYGYDILEAGKTVIDGKTYQVLKALKIFEVSPVLLGAGVDTHVVDIKANIKKAIPSHSTDTSEGSWDAAGNVKRLKADQTYSYYRKMFAWVAPDGDPTKKTSYKFPHHEVDGDGNIGAANIKACVSIIGALNGARGGTTIPDADRKGVWSHAARHLKDADLEPAPLKDSWPDSMKYLDQIEFTTEAVQGIIERTEEILKLREGKKILIAEASLDGLRKTQKAVADLSDTLDGLIKGADAEYKLYMQYMAIENQIKQGENYA